MRSRNMRRTGFIVLVVATCLLCLARPSLCDVSAENNSDKSAGENKEPKKRPEDKPVAVENLKSHVVKPSNDNKEGTAAVAAVIVTKANNPGTGEVTSNVQSPAAVKVKNEVGDTEESSKAPEQPIIGHATSLNPGAFKRGFYVFVGLSVLAVVYIVFRSFRLNKSRTQMVRKYGVLAHKQDIEMRPLPLDEDDEDDTTVFDASGLSPPPRLQS